VSDGPRNMSGFAGDLDFLNKYDEGDTNEGVADFLRMSRALRAYGLAAHPNPNPLKHERAFQVFTRTGADDRLKKRVVNCYFAIVAPVGKAFVSDQW